MIWAVLIAGAVIVLVLQLSSAEKALEVLDADRCPEALLAEPGEPFSIRISLCNRSRRLIPFVSARCRLAFTDAGSASFCAWLGPRQVLERRVAVTVPRRGRYVLEALQISCGDFLGLKEQSKTCGSFREVVAAPRALPSPRLDTLLGGFLGDVSANRFILEDPVLTLGFREYTGLEPMKRISWVQSARHNALMVKKNDYTVEPSVSVLLNVQTDLEDREDTLEVCFSAARTVCAALEEKGIRYSFTSNAQLLGRRDADSGADGLGRRHFGAILEALGRACGEHTVPLERMLEKELQRPGQSGRILITPGGSEAGEASLTRLREAGSVLVIKGTEAALWQ